MRRGVTQRFMHCPAGPAFLVELITCSSFRIHEAGLLLLHAFLRPILACIPHYSQHLHHASISASRIQQLVNHHIISIDRPSSTASLAIPAMSGLLGKLAGQLTTGSGSGSGSGSDGSGDSFFGPGKIIHTLTDKATGQTHPQDLTSSSQNPYPSGGPGPYVTEPHPQQQPGRDYQKDEYQQSHAGYVQGGHGGYQQPEGYPAHEGHLQPGQFGRKQRVGEYQQGHDVYGQGGDGGHQMSGGHQQMRGPNYGQNAQAYHQEGGQSHYQQPEHYPRAGGYQQADGRGYVQGQLGYGQRHSGYELEQHGREQSQGGYWQGHGNPQQGHGGYPQVHGGYEQGHGGYQ